MVEPAVPAGSARRDGGLHLSGWRGYHGEGRLGEPAFATVVGQFV